ncbi:MAG TPA: exonuclease SbcCD subunit D [Actinomycetota bacterium]|nr:exonuclease SbcCD subunit D [Actinomycetota bacterium]
MRILHTADWHVGKRLGRLDRVDEARSALAEIAQIARDRRVDVVVVAGDLFDRGVPPFVSLRVVLDALVELTATGAHVVAVPGNHDSADLFEVLAPHLAHSRVTLVHKPLRATEGGVVEVPSRDGAEVARIACFPFLHQAHVVEFMETHEDRHKSYADRVRAIARHYATHLAERPRRNAVDVLVGHFMVHGAVPAGSERPLHVGEAYMATPDAVPHQFHYVALGHIHKPQPVAGSDDYARYAGSLLQLDFGEAGEDKSVVVADVSPQGRRALETVPVTSGRRLMRVSGTLDELKNRADELRDAILAVDVVTDRPSSSLADDVHAFLPDALYVRVDDPGREPVRTTRAGRGFRELYGEYHAERHGGPPPAELLAELDALADEVGVDL